MFVQIVWFSILLLNGPPHGYGSLEGVIIPNVEESSHPAKLYTAHFKEV